MFRHGVFADTAFGGSPTRGDVDRRHEWPAARATMDSRFGVPPILQETSMKSPPTPIARRARLDRWLAATVSTMALATAGWAASAYAGNADTAADSATSRAAVRNELFAARADGRVTPAGEIGDTAAVIAARDDHNARVTAEAAAARAHAVAEAERALRKQQEVARTEDDRVITLGELFQMMEHAADRGSVLVVHVGE